MYLIAERSKLEARGKYLVTSIDEDSCTLRKFTRHHFRKKEYVVAIHDVYPIVISDRFISNATEILAENKQPKYTIYFL